MKKNALAVIGIVAVLVLGIIGVSANTVAQENNSNSVATVGKPKLTVEAARKIALRKYSGEITEETTLEEEDGKIISYIFKIKKGDKNYEVEIDADSGDVLYADEAQPA